ncbi:MAG: thioredoxin family protein [Akkermansia sp.]|nr:thioredoxin family protein [Akkermansia sp.]
MKPEYVLPAIFGAACGYLAAPRLLPVLTDSLYGDKIITIRKAKPAPKPQTTSTAQQAVPAAVTPGEPATVHRGLVQQPAPPSYTFEFPSANSVIGKILEKSEYLTETLPNLHAEYYVFLNSASWCPPCRATMPKIAEIYPKISKHKRVELVLFSYDVQPEKGIEFVKKNNGNFPIIARKNRPELPGEPKVTGIPRLHLYRADGTFLKPIGTAHLQRIQEIAPPLSVTSAIAEIHFITTPPADSPDYYIFLQITSRDKKSRTILPKIIREYKKFRQKGIELILVCDIHALDDIQKLSEKYKINIPATTPSELTAIPGYTPSAHYPYAVILDKNGRKLDEGESKIIHKWQKIIKKDTKNLHLINSDEL